MTIDEQLRNALHERADGLTAPPDPVAAIERRARGIHRRRVATAVAGATMVLAAVGAATPAIMNALDGGTPSTPYAVSPPSTSASPSQVPDPSTVLGWPMAGDPAVAASLSEGQMYAWVREQQPFGWGDPTDLHVLWAGDLAKPAGKVVVFTVRSGDHVMAGAWLMPTDQAAKLVALHDVEDKAAQVSVVLDKQVAVVVGAPTTGQILYARAYGAAFTPVETTDRTAVIPLGDAYQPGVSVPQIKVVDGDGNLAKPAYEGPIGRGLTFPDV